MRCSEIFTNMIDGIQGLRPDTDTSAWVSLHSSKSTLNDRKNIRILDAGCSDGKATKNCKMWLKRWV